MGIQSLARMISDLTPEAITEIQSKLRLSVSQRRRRASVVHEVSWVRQ